MRVRLNVLALTMLILISAPAAFALDAPHTPTTGVNCTSCHFSSKPPYWTDPNINDSTPKNRLCLQCHDASASAAVPVKTHSSHSLNSATYGTWMRECVQCHDPHYQKQVRKWGSASYLYSGVSSSVTSTTITQSSANWKLNEWQGMILIPNTANLNYTYRILSNTSNTITVQGTINQTFAKPGNTFAVFYGKLLKDYINGRFIKLFRSEGKNSLADGDGTIDNACEVCHTKTKYFRNNLTGDNTHNSGTKCSLCHNHVASFKPSGGCTKCHGNPPYNNISSLVTKPGPTGSTTTGAHALHVNTKSYNCDNCHVNSAGMGSTHYNGLRITLGFSVFDGKFKGGSYDGQTTANYDSSDPATTVSKTGAKTCNNIYCHSNAAPFDKPNVYKQAVWDGSALSCNSCHDTGGVSTGLSGRHAKHVNAPYAFKCERCHFDTVFANITSGAKIKNQALHVNGVKDVKFKEGGTYDKTTKSCNNTYCHGDGRGGAPIVPVKWSDTNNAMACDSCHKGRSTDPLTMSSDGHERLVGKGWIRKYPCHRCHNDTMDASNNIKDYTKHVNGIKDVAMPDLYSVDGKPKASYNNNNITCYNVYCHGDGTKNPSFKDLRWDQTEHVECDACHGHPISGTCSTPACHPKGVQPWKSENKWKASMPMYSSTGPGTDRANSHPRHLMTNFSCDVCHKNTINEQSCNTAGCHTGSGRMTEASHLNPDFHVNLNKNVIFNNPLSSYNSSNKTCINSDCHKGATPPKWGDSVGSAIICYDCHIIAGAPDVDDFGILFNNAQARINLAEWKTTGHGRPASAGNYPGSGNPAANFPQTGNPCWYCHDFNVLHQDTTNPFRLKIHPQFEKRFEKECVYCHMEQGKESECLNCHYAIESLAPQVGSVDVVAKHSGATYTTGCLIGGCHDKDENTHKTEAGFWTAEQKDDIRNQYLMMGVCLQCHEDDRNGMCTKCHTGPQYKLGYDPGTGFIKAQKARASSVHYGYKHMKSGTKMGGKFCWDCHDPHGDTNIYMIQNKVATETDGRYGMPVPGKRKDVVFTDKAATSYASTGSGVSNRICNVCHTKTAHYTQNYGDGHQIKRRCTECHEHKFADSHASGRECDSCHKKTKPVPSHTGFSQPKDCTKCHAIAINARMNIMKQMTSLSHHVQGVKPNNIHCYACHWEATEHGMIDPVYHEGFNFKNHSTIKDAKVDLVLWQPGRRPTVYNLISTATVFLANKIGTAGERTEVTKINAHCLSCHTDANNDTDPFGDCKTPRQYAWDGSSIAARYSNKGTTTWGKYPSTSGAAQKNITKSFSAHGNATDNAGGWRTSTGVDGTIPNLRAGTQNVQCFDCHSSHGSYTAGITSSYVTFNGTKNGGNLKETQNGVGGYSVTYKAKANSTGINPYSTGAAQCFDCHFTENAGTMPWGYKSTFGAISSIKSYMDSFKFGDGSTGPTRRYPYKAKSLKGGHLKPFTNISTATADKIGGLCSPCHDPHGVSRSLGDDMKYAVPLLKGTWMTSPYKEDVAQNSLTNPPNKASISHPSNVVSTTYVYTDQKTFGGSARIGEDDTKFAGLCLQCHPKSTLMATSQNWKGIGRVHKTVKGWGGNVTHSFTCSKCHTPHVSDLPKLMTTNCLDYKHRGRGPSGGQAGVNNNQWSWPSGDPYWYDGSFPLGVNSNRVNCHPTGKAWPDNYWNWKTPW